MLPNHHSRALLACLAAMIGSQGCQTPQGPEGAEAGAMPEDPRGVLKEARFREAVKGLDFETGLVIVVEPTGDDRRQAVEYHTEGLQRLESNRLTGALTMFALTVRTDPDWPAAYNSLGKGLEVKGKSQYALAAYRTALSLDPGFAEAQYNLASALAGLGRHGEAIEEMLVALDLDPQRAEAHERLAIWYYYSEDPGSAWRHVHAARDLGREPPPHFVSLLEAEMPDPGTPAAGE
jgi:tetratricopeptide (TPR) repeat protein